MQFVLICLLGKLTTEEPMKSNCYFPAFVVGGENASASSGHPGAVYEKRKEKKGVSGQIKKLQNFFCFDLF